MFIASRDDDTQNLNRSHDNGTKIFTFDIPLADNQPLTIITKPNYVFLLFSDIELALDQLEQTVRQALHDGTILTAMKKEKKTIVRGFTATRL